MVAAAFFAWVLASAPIHPALAATLTGQVHVGIAGLTLADAGAIVVFVEAGMNPPAAAGRALPSVAIRQHGARFEPDFVAVSVGQEVRMPNDDTIYHNVFSYSEPNDFDLGLYAAGQSRTLRFEHPGLVRIYCSIHEGMDGLIFVAPLPLKTVADAEGRFTILDVPEGSYRLHVWSERLPEVVRPIEVPASDKGRVGTAGSDGALELELEIGATPGA